MSIEFPLPELDQSDTRTESSRDSSSIHSDLYAGIKYWGNPTILRCVFKKCGKNIGIDGWVPHLVDHIDDISELPYPIVWKCELGPSCSEDLPTPTTLECLFRHTLDHFIRARCDEDARKAYNSLLEILASNGANGVASSVGDNYLQCHGQETGYSVYHSVAHIVCGAGEQYSQHRDIDRSYITNRSEPRRSEAHQPESRSSVADLEAQPAEEPQSDTASNASSISLESRESQVYLSYGELQSRGERSRGEQKYYS